MVILRVAELNQLISVSGICRLWDTVVLVSCVHKWTVVFALVGYPDKLHADKTRPNLILKSYQSPIDREPGQMSLKSCQNPISILHERDVGAPQKLTELSLIVLTIVPTSCAYLANKHTSCFLYFISLRLNN